MSSLEAQQSRTPEGSTRPSGRPSWPQARTAVVECVVLAVACLITYEPVTSALSRVYSLSRDDDLLGGMWAVLATIFVLRDSFRKSVAAVSPQHAWQQPILRLVDTVVGVAVGAIAAWIAMRVKSFRPARSGPPAPAKTKIDLSERSSPR
jgi:hypothetical protein